MNKDVSAQLVDLFKNPEIVEGAKECKSMEDFYEVCNEHLPGVSKEEFNEALREMNDSNLLDENDLESISGGGWTVGYGVTLISDAQ